MSRVQKIVILGGGTSGWLAASYLHKALHGNVQITLIESSRIGTIGVGEATVPSIKQEVFDFLGIDESEWMPRCNASYKLGIRYENWAEPPSSGKPHYFHNFGEIEEIEGMPLSHFWLRKRLMGSDEPLHRACYVTGLLNERCKSPRHFDGRTETFYAYHFDAGLLGSFLREWAMARGVMQVVDEVVQVLQDERGNITSLRTAGGSLVDGDLFIDCSGFRSLLLTETLKEPFMPFSENLLNDRAVAILAPHRGDEIRPYTTATALTSGWVWQIPLYSRNGCGYVYSSQYIDPGSAEEELRRFLGLGPDEGKANHIRMRTGRHRRAWVNNCVGIGLAGGFIEPLESTGIYFIYAALYQLVRHFPSLAMEPALRDSFNERVGYMIDDVRDFIVMHYCTTSREDTPYWRANKNDLMVSESLKWTLEQYRSGMPVKRSYSGPRLYEQFEASFDRFWTNSNYISILAGMNYLPAQSSPILEHRPGAIEAAEGRFRAIRGRCSELAETLPGHREYLTKLHEAHASTTAAE
jgi:tryptophan 7-halogenase